MVSVNQTAEYYLRFLSFATAFVFFVVMFTAHQSSLWLWIALSAAALVGGILSLSIFVRFIILTCLWSLALGMSGGAENAANALQLILIAGAFLSLPTSRAWIIFGLVTAVQLVFLLLLITGNAQHAMHGGQSHYLGMSLSFFVAACLLAFAISKMQRSLSEQLIQVQQMREEQLRQEQILAMGTASAQITHELATPLATIALLHDELEVDQPEHPLVKDLTHPIRQVRDLLNNLRTVAEQIQHQRGQTFTITELEAQLRQQVALNFAQARVEWQLSNAKDVLSADLTLVPAILGLIRNALNYSTSEDVAIVSQCEGGEWLFSIRNQTSALSQERLLALKELGYKAIKSKHGLGVGVLLSHATLERFFGSLQITLSPDGTFTQAVRLPLIPTVQNGKV